MAPTARRDQHKTPGVGAEGIERKAAHGSTLRRGPLELAVRRLTPFFLTLAGMLPTPCVGSLTIPAFAESPK